MSNRKETEGFELETLHVPPEIVPGWVAFIDTAAVVRAVANNYWASGQEWDSWWHASGANDLPLNTELISVFGPPLPKLGSFAQFNHLITSFAYSKAEVPSDGTGVFTKISSPDLSVVYMVKHRSMDNTQENWWYPSGYAFKANNTHFKITTTDRAGVLALLEPGGSLAAAPRRKHNISAL